MHIHVTQLWKILLINHFYTSITVQVCNLYTRTVDRAESSVGRYGADSVWVYEPVSPILSINSSNISGALDVSIYRQCTMQSIDHTKYTKVDTQCLCRYFCDTQEKSHLKQHTKYTDKKILKLNSDPDKSNSQY